MALPNVILVNGAAMGHGKSTVANYLCEKYEYQLLKFADPIKDMVRALLRYVVTPAQIERYVEGDWKTKPLPLLGGRSVRYLLQTIGSEWGRDFVDPKVWANLCRHRTLTLTLGGARVVVDDWRFWNEGEAVIEVPSTVTWRVVDPRKPMPREHRSEGELDTWPFKGIITNGATLDELYQRLDIMMQDLSW